MRNFVILLLANYLGDYIKENEVGRPCGMQWGEERCMLGSGG
jgi:hypothetical protein